MSYVDFRSSTRSTWPTSSSIRVTTQSTPFPRNVSPTEGTVPRVKSYWSSPFGSWITTLFVDTGHLLPRKSPLLATANQHGLRVVCASLSWFDRHPSEVQRLASQPSGSVPRTRGELLSCGRPSRVTRQAPPTQRLVLRLPRFLQLRLDPREKLAQIVGHVAFRQAERKERPQKLPSPP